MKVAQTITQAQGAGQSSADLLSKHRGAIEKLARSTDPIERVALADEVRRLGLELSKALRAEQELARKRAQTLQASVADKVKARRLLVDEQLQRAEAAKRVLGEEAAALRALQGAVGDAEAELAATRRVAEREAAAIEAAVADALLGPDEQLVRYLVAQLDLDSNGAYRFGGTVRCMTDRGFGALERFMNTNPATTSLVFAEIRRRRDGLQVDPGITIDDN